MAFYNISDGGTVVDSNPQATLIAPDGSYVPKHPLDPPTNNGVAQDLYALPQTGKYLMIAQNYYPNAFYKISYSFQSPPTVDEISIVSGNDQIIPCVSGGTTTFSTLKVKVSYKGNSASDIPVIFEVANKEYLFFSDSDGIATAVNVKTPSPPVQGTIFAYPAGHPGLKIKFNYVIVEAFSKDDWDGDGVPNIVERNQGTNPFNLDSNNDGILDGYPLSITPKDIDGDGLTNDEEIALGTDPNNIDTDGDLYPDGFEYENHLDPLNPDTVSLNFILLENGLYPNPNSVKLYVVAKDITGHFRPNIPITVQQSNMNYEDFPNTDLRGISFTYFYPNTLVDGKYPIGKMYPVQGARQWAIVSSPYSASSAKIALITYSCEDPPISKVNYTDNQYTNPLQSPQYPLKVFVGYNQQNPSANTLVTFKVLSPEVETPPGFINGSLSKNCTPGTPEFECPCQYVFNDGRAKITQELKVYTDEDGYARAVFYAGNASNFTYKIKAKVEDGNSVVFAVHTYLQPSSHCYTAFKLADQARLLVGDIENVYLICKDFKLIPDSCITGGVCAYELEPLSGLTVDWKMVKDGDTIELPDSQTDSNGVAVYKYAVQEGIVQIYDEAKPYATLSLNEEIRGYKKEDIKIIMKKLNPSQGLVELKDGGTVASSHINPLANDYRITVTYSPKLTRYLELRLTESGKDVLTYLPSGILPQDKMIFYPDVEGLPTTLTFKVNHPAPEAEFEFILLGSSDVIDSSTAHTKNDYLYFHCTGSPMCEGFLEWKDANGITLMKWNALSGCNSPPCEKPLYKLPSRTYKIFEFIFKPKNSSWCDVTNFCWAAKLEPWKFYYNGQLRWGFEIHPDGGIKGTEGCIGISDPVTHLLYLDLFFYKLLFGKMRVIVQ